MQGLYNVQGHWRRLGQHAFSMWWWAGGNSFADYMAIFAWNLVVWVMTYISRVNGLINQVALTAATQQVGQARASTLLNQAELFLKPDLRLTGDGQHSRGVFMKCRRFRELFTSSVGEMVRQHDNFHHVLLITGAAWLHVPRLLVEDPCKSKSNLATP